MAISWTRIKTAYLKGDMTYKDLAQKYGVAEKTIRNHASKEGWRNERDKIKAEVGQAIHARAREHRVEQLEKLIEANDLTINSLLKLAQLVNERPEFYLRDDKAGLRNAADLTKAIQTAVQTQRDLHKLPTLEQDMEKKAEAARKRETKRKLDLEEEKWEAAKLEKAKAATEASGTVWQINEPEDGEETDG